MICCTTDRTLTLPLKSTGLRAPQRSVDNSLPCSLSILLVSFSFSLDFAHDERVFNTG